MRGSGDEIKFRSGHWILQHSTGSHYSSLFTDGVKTFHSVIVLHITMAQERNCCTESVNTVLLMRCHVTFIEPEEWFLQLNNKPTNINTKLLDPPAMLSHPVTNSARLVWNIPELLIFMRIISKYSIDQSAVISNN